MARTKLTVRRLNRPIFVPTLEHRIGNKNVLKKRNNEFKIKRLLPQTKTVQIKKNGHVGTMMRVRRKTTYFTGRRTLRF